MKSGVSKVGASILPSAERRPVAFPIETAPKSPQAVFVYSPLKREWRIAVRAQRTWFDRLTGEEIDRPTHWMPLAEIRP